MELDWAAARRSLLGVAVGDSLGLPYEGLSGTRGIRMMPLPIRQRLFFGRGFVSDDTVLSAIALASLSATQAEMQRKFAKGLRCWFLSIPPGIGLSTIKACLRLCVGIPATRSGVPSAGNGAAMRAAAIGAAYGEDHEARIEAVDAISRVTHTHPLAIQGAQLIALAAVSREAFEAHANEVAPDWPWSEGWPERGPTGYVVHSVNAAIHIWKTTSSFEEAITKVIQLGGDTDTVGAMVGGIIGLDAVPSGWDRYYGWPQPGHIAHIHAGQTTPYLRLLGANLAALPIILAHGFRRMLPPY